MKALIILFSPSDNTRRIGKMVEVELIKKGICTQFIDITRNEEYFTSNDKSSYLNGLVRKHDILFIGSPVYAHHLQYHVKELINALPAPSAIWGNAVVPFVTYGGVNSGIALEEAGKLLKRSGRKVLGGMKISSSHRMTRAFMENEYNKQVSEDKAITTVQQLAKYINDIDMSSLEDSSKILKYQSIMTGLKANIIFKEKVWHKKRYPNVTIDENKCNKCGKCITVCPVCHLGQDDSQSIIRNKDSNCIHCFNCLVECPQNSIYLVGDMDKARDFMNKIFKISKEKPGSYLYIKK